MSSDVNVLRKFAESWPERSFVQEVLAQITRFLPDEWKASQPTIEEIEAELGEDLG